MALSAQGPGRTQVRCAGQVVTEVVIRSEGPSFGAAFQRSATLGRMLSRTHTPTAPDVIRNLLLLKRGDRCTPLRRSESERVLRAMPFIADASVTAYQDGTGVRLEVITVDEPSLVADVGLRNGSPYVWRTTVGTANLLGEGVYASAQWRDGGFYRDGFAARYTNYQLWTQPYQLDIRGVRREVGGDWYSQLSFPFLTELQRMAWRVSAGHSREYPRFLRPDTLAAAVALRREYVDAGVLARIGPPGRRGLLGLQFSVEDVEPGAQAVVITPRGITRDTVSALRGRYAPFRSVRLNGLIGFRRLRFERVTGFDALAGSQDLQTGIQVSGTVGRALPNARGVARGELVAGADVYAGVGGARSFFGLEAQLDGRRRSGVSAWDDLLADGRAAWYLKPHARHLITADVRWTVAQDTRLPVQLSLGDDRGGVRGFRRSWYAGDARVVGRVEERWRVVGVRGAATAAAALFAEVGRVNAGDVPLGTSSGWQPAVGLSAIVAAPPRSQRMWRVDLAIPLRSGGGGRVELRMRSENRTQVFWREPNDIRLARERVIPTSLFRWP